MKRCKDCNVKMRDAGVTAQLRCDACRNTYLEWLLQKCADDARSDRQNEDSEVPE